MNKANYGNIMINSRLNQPTHQECYSRPNSNGDGGNSLTHLIKLSAYRILSSITGKNYAFLDAFNSTLRNRVATPSHLPRNETTAATLPHNNQERIMLICSLGKTVIAPSAEEKTIEQKNREIVAFGCLAYQIWHPEDPSNRALLPDEIIKNLAHSKEPIDQFIATILKNKSVSQEELNQLDRILG